VVPAADLRYFDASHFALGQNAEAIAHAIIQTFAGDDGSPKRAAALKLIEVITGTVLGVAMPGDSGDERR
jgi:hypothetical protein